MKTCAICNKNKDKKLFKKAKQNIDKLSKCCVECIDIKNNIIFKSYIYKDSDKLINKKVGKIKVLSFSKRISSKGHSSNILKVKCDCGKLFETKEGNVKSGNTTSCGCVQVKHRLTKDPIYSNYNQMMQRCYNKKNKNYNYCGKRGISVYQEWVDSPTKYIEWVKQNLGSKLSGFSIDRIDNNGNYEPGNLRWASRHQQAQNTTLNVISGDIACKIYREYHSNNNISQVELAKKYNCTKHTIYRIVRRRQWTNYTKNITLQERPAC